MITVRSNFWLCQLVATMALRYQMELQPVDEESEWDAMVNRIGALEARCDNLSRDLNQRLNHIEQTLQQILTAMRNSGQALTFKSAPVPKATFKAPQPKATTI